MVWPRPQPRKMYGKISKSQPQFSGFSTILTRPKSLTRFQLVEWDLGFEVREQSARFQFSDVISTDVISTEEPRWCEILGLCDLGDSGVTRLLRAAEEDVHSPGDVAGCRP